MIKLTPELIKDRAREIIEFELRSLLMEIESNYKFLSADEIRDMIQQEANFL